STGRWDGHSGPPGRSLPGLYRPGLETAPADPPIHQAGPSCEVVTTGRDPGSIGRQSRGRRSIARRASLPPGMGKRPARSEAPPAPPDPGPGVAPRTGRGCAHRRPDVRGVRLPEVDPHEQHHAPEPVDGPVQVADLGARRGDDVFRVALEVVAPDARLLLG